MSMPVEPATLAAFAVAVLAIVMSPGPDTMLTWRPAHEEMWTISPSRCSIICGSTALAQ